MTKRLEGREEPILDPDLPIVDAHHHLFDSAAGRYMADDLVADMQAGHNVVASIYCEAQSFARCHGPEVLRPVGEVEFANGVGATYASGAYGNVRPCAGIIGFADLTLGDEIGVLLDRCQAVAPDRYRGVRQVTVDYPDDRPFNYIMTMKPRRGLLDHPAFSQGLAQVATRGLCFDAAVWDPSLPRLTQLVDAHPGLMFVLDHIGTAIGVDMDAIEKAAVFARWRQSLRELARRPNVHCKVGGLGLPMWGFDFHQRAEVVGYADLAAAWRPFVETAIEAFGPDRCMMESNFAPDGRSCGYVPLWNALKHVTRQYSAAERRAMFYDNAVATYRLDLSL